MDSTLLAGYEFAVFLYGGLLLGLAAVLLSRLRRLLPNRFFCHALDFLFLLAAGYITAAAFYTANGGEFRLFGALTMLAGTFLASGSVGRLLPCPARALYIRKKTML